MLYWTLACFVLALVAGLLSFGGLAVAAPDVARVLFGLFVALFLAALAARRWLDDPPS